MDKIKTFVERLDKIGIKVQLYANYPWVYLDQVNGKRVTETFRAKHGFTLCFLPIREGQEFKFTDITRIFEVIRKYI